MATKKSAAKSTTYWWDATATDPVIASALAVLAKRYPALKAKKAPGAAELVFKKGADGVCSAALGDGRYVITYGRPNMAVRMVGNILAGAVPAAPAAAALWIDATPPCLAALAAGAILSLPVVPALRRLARRALPEPAAWAAESLWATLLGLAAALFVAGGTHQAFLYFKF